MTISPIARRAAVAGLAVLTLTAGYHTLKRNAGPAAETTLPAPGASAEAPLGDAPGVLYGRVRTYGSTVYEGRLRWGGDEEAFWTHTFNGFKDENPWAAQTPLGQTEERHPITVFGVEIPLGERPADLGRPFMARFGDVARIEARGDGLRAALENGTEFDPDVRVTLKSGAAFTLDRLSAGDFDDGVRVWDRRRGVVDLGPRQIRSIEFLSTPQLGGVPVRLHGTVRTRQGAFTGFLQWDREQSTGGDRLVGRTADGETGLRFDAVRSIARDPQGGLLVTRLDGREVVLADARTDSPGNRGVYIEDPRYGRVLVSWAVFERVDFSPGGSGPAYGDFPPGRPLTGRVTTRDGRRLEGRLVYDLDESETTETLDAPFGGVDYTLTFGLVASVVLPGRAAGRAQAPARVTLQSGEVLPLDRDGDLGEANAGLLVFADGRERPEYVPWADVERVDFTHLPAELPPPTRSSAPAR